MTEIANTKKASLENDEQGEIALGWHLKLFEKSVLKQAKLKNLKEELGATEGLKCLDLGSDNGVISYFLRKLGGQWYSADLSQETVDSIRSLVTENVFLIDGVALPFENQFFDVIVVVDMLEHLEDDVRFLFELERILKPGGRLIINTPNRKPFSILRGVRELIGQGDEEHGHIRSGYTIENIKAIIPDSLEITKSWTYSHFFSEAIDTCIVFAYRVMDSLKNGKSQQSNGASEEVSKGLVMTEDKIKSFEKSFSLYSSIYPIVRSVAALDSLIRFIPGYMRLAVLKKS